MGCPSVPTWHKTVRSALRSPFAGRSPPRSHHRGLSEGLSRRVLLSVTGLRCLIVVVYYTQARGICQPPFRRKFFRAKARKLKSPISFPLEWAVIHHEQPPGRLEFALYFKIRNHSAIDTAYNLQYLLGHSVNPFRRIHPIIPFRCCVIRRAGIYAYVNFGAYDMLLSPAKRFLLY